MVFLIKKFPDAPYSSDFRPITILSPIYKLFETRFLPRLKTLSTFELLPWLALLRKWIYILIIIECIKPVRRCVKRAKLFTSYSSIFKMHIILSFWNLKYTSLGVDLDQKLSLCTALHRLQKFISYTSLKLKGLFSNVSVDFKMNCWNIFVRPILEMTSIPFSFCPLKTERERNVWVLLKKL